MNDWQHSGSELINELCAHLSDCHSQIQGIEKKLFTILNKLNYSEIQDKSDFNRMLLTAMNFAQKEECHPFNIITAKLDCILGIMMKTTATIQSELIQNFTPELVNTTLELVPSPPPSSPQLTHQLPQPPDLSLTCKLTPMIIKHLSESLTAQPSISPQSTAKQNHDQFITPKKRKSLYSSPTKATSTSNNKQSQDSKLRETNQILPNVILKQKAIITELEISKAKILNENATLANTIDILKSEKQLLFQQLQNQESKLNEFALKNPIIILTEQ